MANPYLNTPPTKLKKLVEKEKNAKKKKQMRDALNAWRLVVPGPFSIGRRKLAKELLSIANLLLGE